MRSLLMATVALAGAILASAPARADLLMMVDSNLINDNSAQDSDSRTGVISFRGTVGNFNTNLSTQTGTFAASPLYFDLANSLVSSTGAGSLTIKLTTTGLTSPAAASQFLTQFSGNYTNAGSTVSALSFLDTSNTAFGTGTLLGSLNPAASPFGLSNQTVAGGTTPFSLTEVITITTTGSSSFSLDTSISATAVPEPATLGLLGTGVLALVASSRRRRHTQTTICA